MNQSQSILQVTDLHVSFPSEAGTVQAVRGLSFTLERGKTLAIVGESGSGKSVTALAIMGLLSENAKVTGSVTLEGEELLGKTDAEMSKIRGKDIGMIFQDPLSALTPVFDVGTQISEALLSHNNMSKKQAWERSVELLEMVGIPDPERRARAFPHEFSGGMRQRVVIAIAIANNPKVLIADEPTTALDVTIQAQILDLIKVAQRETNAATIMITHDMGVVAEMADDVAVMYAGRPVETADVFTVFREPQMPYTIGLLGSIPSATDPDKAALVTIPGNPPKVIDMPQACPFAQRCPIAVASCHEAEPPLVTLSDAHRVACVRAHEISDGKLGGQEIYTRSEIPAGILAAVPREQRQPVLEVNELSKQFPLLKGALLKRRVGTVYAVDGVSFEIREGECFSIVGESGSGKTTTLLEVMDLKPERQGEIRIGGSDVADLTRAQRAALRSRIQIVFQDPMGALDPRLTIDEIIREPLEALGWEGNHAERVGELMDLVGLDRAYLDRFPGAFSGGQRQRINIARALAVEPKLLVLDEPVSALDVSIQAGILNLLDELKARLGISFLLVAHDLSVIRHISDRAAVMYLGRFVEVGNVDELFENPRHPYTKALLSAIPVPDPELARSRERIVLADAQPQPTQETIGCGFRDRCPLYLSLDEEGRRLCQSTRPPMAAVAGHADHAVACHHAA